MEVTYSLEQKDISHFQDYCLTGNTKIGKFKAKAWRFSSLIIGVSSVGYRIFHSPTTQIAVHAMLGTVGWFVGLALLFFLLRLWEKKREKKSPAKILQTQTVRLTEYGVSVQSVIDETTVAWSKLFGIDEDATHLYLLLSKYHGYIVPKRVFQSVSEERQFYEAATELRSQALQNPSVLPPKTAPSGARSQRQIRYTVSNADLNHGYRFLSPHTTVKKAIIFPLVTIGIFVLVAVPSLVAVRHFSFQSAAPLMLSLMVPIGLAVGFLIYLYYRNPLAARIDIPELSEPQTVTFDTEQVVFFSAVAETVVQWENLADVVTDDRMIYFFTPERQAYMVPYHAFATLDDAREFHDLARKCWQSARTGEPLAELPKSVSWPPPPTG